MRAASFRAARRAPMSHWQNRPAETFRRRPSTSSAGPDLASPVRGGRSSPPRFGFARLVRRNHDLCAVPRRIPDADRCPPHRGRTRVERRDRPPQGRCRTEPQPIARRARGLCRKARRPGPPSGQPSNAASNFCPASVHRCPPPRRRKASTGDDLRLGAPREPLRQSRANPERPSLSALSARYDAIEHRQKETMAALQGKLDRDRQDLTRVYTSIGLTPEPVKAGLGGLYIPLKFGIGRRRHARPRTDRGKRGRNPAPAQRPRSVAGAKPGAGRARSQRFRQPDRPLPRHDGVSQRPRSRNAFRLTGTRDGRRHRRLGRLERRLRPDGRGAPRPRLLDALCASVLDCGVGRPGDQDRRYSRPRRYDRPLDRTASPLRDARGRHTARSPPLPCGGAVLED